MIISLFFACQVKACPPGAVPIPGQGRCGSPAEASAIRSSSSAASSAPARTEIWEDRYGAIAEDPSGDGGGAVENQKTKRDAERGAISKCGGGGCKVVSSIRNTCQAVVYGGGVRVIGSGNTEILAVSKALSICKRGGLECESRYVGCSLPVRVR
ncbi:DUF4189 domain-containing protein [Solilutibacter pythonis]